MCDLTGFVILIPVPDTLSTTLARAFMEQVLLRVGFCGLIVPDAASSFKATAAAMGTAPSNPPPVAIIKHAPSKGFSAT
jgi:hypothetical protein